MSPIRWVDRILTDAAWVGVGVGFATSLANGCGLLGPPASGMCGNTFENFAPQFGFVYLVGRWSLRGLLRLSARFEQTLDRWGTARVGCKPKTPSLDEL